MQSCGKRVAGALLSAAVASVSLLLAGCDTETGRTDRRVHDTVAEAARKRVSRTEMNVDAAVTQLQDTIGQQDASPATKAISRGALAQAELDSANMSMVELISKENEIRRTIIQIHNLLAQISRSNTLIAGFNKLNPSATVTSINQAIADARGGEGKPEWVKQDKGTIRSQAGLKAEESRLRGEIDKLNNELKTLNEQRAKALADASAADAASLTAKGKESVDLYKKGSDLRKQAADLQIKIDEANLKLVPFEDDLKIVMGHLDVIDKVIAAYEQQIAEIQKGWTEVQAEIAEQQKIITDLVEGKSPAAEGTTSAGLSISEKAAHITRLAGELAKLRETTERKLNDSIQHFNDAATAADDLRSRLQKLQGEEAYQNKPETEAWKMLLTTLDTGGYRLQQGGAERTKAEMYTSQALTALARLNLSSVARTILDAGRVKLPADLEAGNLEREMQDARGLAEAMFQSASDRFQKIFDGTSTADRKNAALVARMLTMYQWAQLAAGTNDKAAAQHLSAAVEARNQALANNARLPILPADLAPAPTAAPAPRAPAPAPGETPAPESPGPEAPAPAPAPTPEPAPAPAPE